MGYSANQAMETLNRYLNITEENKEYIDKTKKRGFLITLDSNEKIVIFLYPIVHKKDDTKNYFDTRDSGALERSIAWKFAIDNKLKYFCLGVNDQVDKYKDFIFSLECDEKTIARISGTKDGVRNGSGNQIIIPNSYVPKLIFDRIKNKLGVFISVINKKGLYDYFRYYDNRPYLNNEEVQQVSIQNCDFERNRIIFGAPGTGKSYTLNKEKGELLDKCKNNFERVTFHPEYSYANFVGTYKPVMTTTEYNVSENSEKILKVLTDKSKTAQEKYDLLYDDFKGNGLTRLPLLLGLYTDEAFKTKKQDGSESSGDNSVERNHGRAIRPYVNLYTGTRKTEEISYEYVPGPFMRVLAKALKSGMTDSPEPYLLIIEEINRANVAAVFGDVFQLLDRDSNNVSEYEISTSKDMCMYLAKELGVDESEVETIKIPDNMFIWATMNSADQGVFPMDTAFKRRWDFTYLGIDDAEDTMEASIKDKKYTFGIGDDARLVSWNDIRKAINNELSNETYRINEDKLLGPYFISSSVLLNASNDEFLKVFKNKVLMYLFEDAVKQRRSPFFDNCKDGNKGIRYSEICKAFDTKGVFIFPESISKEFTEKPSSDEIKDTDE